MNNKKEWFIAGAIVLITIITLVTSLIYRHNHPEDVNIKESFAFVDEDVFNDYVGFSVFIESRDFQLVKIEGELNKSIKGNPMNSLGVVRMTESFISNDTLYTLIRTYGDGAVKSKISSSVDSTYASINPYDWLDDWISLYDAIRMLKRSDYNMDTNHYQIITNENTLYYVFGSDSSGYVRINMRTKEISYL